MHASTRPRSPRTALVAAAAMALAVPLGVGLAPAASAADAGTVGVMTPELQSEIQRRVEAYKNEHDVPGLSVAVVTPNPDPQSTNPVTTIFTAGVPDLGAPATVDASTQFEIASETKVFTADLLAYLVAAGRVSLDDTVQQYAPAGITVPVWTDPATGATTPITLGDLATQQSGLTDEEDNFRAGCGNDPGCVNPRPGYTQTMMWDGLRDATLLWEPGTRYLYSDWGFGLLGLILSNIIEPSAGGDVPPAFEAALTATFLADLGMTSTQLGTGANLATPYTADNQVTWYWDNTNAESGAGGLVSDATDMGVWVAAHLGYNTSTAPLGVRSMADTLQQVGTLTTQCRNPQTCGPAEFQMGLAWQLYAAGTGGVGAPVARKDGSSNGSSSLTALAPSVGVGVTTMMNKPPVGDLATPILALLVPDSTPVTPVGPGPAVPVLPATGGDPVALITATALGVLTLGAGTALTLRRRHRGARS